MSNNLTFGMRLTADGKQLVGEVRVSREELEKLGASTIKAGGAAKQFGASSDEASKRAAAGFGKARDGADALAVQLNRLQALALSYVGVSQFVNFGKALIDTSVAMDGFNAKMAIASGSAKNVAAEYEYLRQLSNRLGTEVRSTADAYASFAAAARGTALEGAKAREVFTGVATASARMSLTADAQQGVFLALSQMMSKGVVSAEEFRQQLGERLPVATTAGAAALGVTTAEFVKLLNSGKLLSEEFLPKFAAQLEKMAGGGGPVDNLQASINRLSNNWTEFQQAVSKSAALKDGTDWFAGLAAGATDVANAVNRTQQEYGTLIALLAGVGFSMAKMTGVELDPQKRAQADLNGMLKEQLALRRDIALLSERGGRLEAEKAAEARARLSELNAQIKVQIDLVNAPVNAAGAAAAKRRADEEAQAATRAASTKKTISDEQVKAIEAEAKSYAKLNKSIAAHIAVLGAEADATAKLPEAYKKLISYLATYKEGLTAQNEAAQQAYIASLAQAAGLEIEAAAQDAATKASKQRTAELDRSVAADQKALDAMTRKNDLMERGIVSVEGMALAELQLQAAMLDSTTVTTEEAVALQKKIDIAEKMIEQAQRGEHLKGMKEEAKAAAKEWEKFTDGIDRTLTDSLQRGFENGKPFGKNFFDSLKATAKTTILKFGVQLIASPIMGGVNGAVGSYGAASGGSGALGYVNAGQTIWSGFSGGMAASMGNLAMSAGEMFGSTALAQFGGGASIVGAGGTAAQVSAAAGAGSAAGIGATVATAMPYIAAAYVAYSLLSGDHGTPTASTGNAAMRFDAQGNRTGMQTYYGGSSAGADAMIAGLQSSYMQSAMSLGIGTAATQFNFGGNTGKNGQSPNFALGGGAGGSSFYQAETATSDAAVQLAASRAVFAALQGSQLPDYLSSVFDGLTAGSLTQQQITDTLAFAQSLKALRDGLAETRTPLEIAQAQMTGLSAEFHTSAATFKTDFVGAIDAGITPQTIAHWQQLGQAIDQVTAANEQAAQAAKAAAAATLSGAQSVYDSAKSTLLDAYSRESDAAQQLADKMRGFASGFAALRGSLSLGNLSPLSNKDKYLEATRQFSDVERRIALGDTAAMEQYSGVQQAFLEASKQYNASSEAYVADYNRAQAVAQSGFEVATRQADISTQQVTVLRDQLGALGLINTSVLSLGEALLAYRQAASGVVAAGGSATGAYTAYAATDITSHVAASGLSSAQQIYDEAVAKNADPYAVGAAYGLDRAGTDAYLQSNNIQRVPGFATGGDHIGGLRIVGERGRELEATGPARIFNADQTRNILSGGGDSTALIAEIKALRAEVAKLREENVQQANQVAGAVDDAASANTSDLRSLKQSLAHGIGKLAA